MNKHFFISSQINKATNEARIANELINIPWILGVGVGGGEGGFGTPLQTN